ncbi:MAG: hypothetical protein NVS3B20_00510 [Polyangiales bacterium]
MLLSNAGSKTSDPIFVQGHEAEGALEIEPLLAIGAWWARMPRQLS